MDAFNHTHPDEAFEELIRIKPDVKVILSSGYTEDIVAHSFPGKPPDGFLNKRCNMEALKGELERLLGPGDSGVPEEPSSLRTKGNLLYIRNIKSEHWHERQ